jgi:hypothetical protein
MTSTLVASLAVVVVGMLLSFAYSSQRLAIIQQELQFAKTQELAALSRLEKLQPFIDAVGGEKTFAERLQDSARQLADKEQVLHAIRGTDFGDTKGFSRHLRSLGRVTIDGIWLTEIRLSGNGDDTRLEGRSINAELVPAYLQFLAAEPPFSAQRFHQFQIDSVDNLADGNVLFSVTSDAEFVAQSVTPQ